MENPLRSERGQSTVEMVLAIPVIVALAAIAFNAVSFFGNCAVFDRVFRDAVRVYAGTVEAGQEPSVCASIAAATQSQLGENCQIQVTAARGAGGTVEYKGRLTMSPTLLGRPLKGEVFGVALPAPTHLCALAVDSFKVG